MRSRDGLTIGFVGYATIEQADSASLLEDDVLALLPSHGAHVVYRGRRVAEQGVELPLEFHVLWFPSRAALDGVSRRSAAPCGDRTFRRRLHAEDHG